MRTLKLWDTYTRQEVHAIFSPDTAFTPQTGTWGLQGIVAMPERAGSFVFFVTFGKKQGVHAFDESITEDGVLTWQSQPKHRLADGVVQSFIQHDDRVTVIHLFLRTRSDVPYYYCGTLGYLSHDDTRERPVHFQWQLMDWPAPPAVLAELGIAPAEPRPAAPAAPMRGVLTEVPPPPPATPGGKSTHAFRGQKRPWHPDTDAKNAALGLAGELLVLKMERQALLAHGRPDLAEKVTHVSVVEGDGAGYDIRAYDSEGNKRYIEVKTTRGELTAAFFISPNEVACSEEHPDRFVLIRVFGYNGGTDSGKYYKIPGPISDSFLLTTTQYRAAFTG